MGVRSLRIAVMFETSCVEFNRGGGDGGLASVVVVGIIRLKTR